MAKRLNEQFRENVVVSSATTAGSVEEFLRRMKDITRQVSGRTRARRLLEALNAGTMQNDTFHMQSARILNDALRRSVELDGIVRLDGERRVAVAVGLDIPAEVWPQGAAASQTLLLSGPVKLGEQCYLIISSPIVDNHGVRAGTDIAAFNLHGLSAVLSSEGRFGRNGRVSIAYESHGVPTVLHVHDATLIAEPLEQAFDTLGDGALAALRDALRLRVLGNLADGEFEYAHAPIEEDAGWMLFVQMPLEDVLGDFWVQLLFSVGLVAVLTVLVAAGMFTLVRPIANGLLVHTGALEQLVEDRTRQFQEINAALAKEVARRGEAEQHARDQADELSRSNQNLEVEIQERHRAQEALRESERRLSKIIDHFPAAISFKDLQGRYFLVNETFQRWCATDGSRALGQTPAEFFGNDHGVTHAVQDQEILDGLETIEEEQSFAYPDGVVREVLFIKFPVFTDSGAIMGVGTVALDVSARKETERELAKLNRELHDAHRLAGMAEVATDVLHNVGNILNSVNVSATVIADRMRTSRSVGLHKLVASLDEHRDDLGQYLATDAKGSRVLDYLAALAEQLADERALVLEEIDSLNTNIGHIKDVVSRQQSYATSAGVTETFSIEQLIDDVIGMNLSGAHQIDVRKDVPQGSDVTADKHAVLQILVNLLKNAKDSLKMSDAENRVIDICVEWPTADQMRIVVRDNGIGITADAQSRIFEHGFTTKADGHGFGLHGSANLAKKMNGNLSCHSDGPGEGATFTLNLPVESRKRAA